MLSLIMITISHFVTCIFQDATLSRELMAQELLATSILPDESDG